MGKGNNSEMVRFVLARRRWLVEAERISEELAFLWDQVPRDFRLTNFKQMIYNHLPFSDEVGNKANLHGNLQKVRGGCATYGRAARRA